MKYEIVDTKQAIKDYIDEKLISDDFIVLNCEQYEVWDMSDLNLSNILNDDIIIIKKNKN